jgi:hypothetical protein
LGHWDVPVQKDRKEIEMKTYAVTVDARVQRTVIVEADNVGDAVIAANAEVTEQLGAYRAEAQEVIEGDAK